ncbi:MAG: FHA domain-containing protein, partial [Mycetocola sp.]
YALVLPGGTRRAIDASVIIGRAPSAPPSAEGALPQLVTVNGDDISRSHIRISVEGGTVVVTDLHSSNGTRVLAGDKPALSLRAGEATPIMAGSTIDLGGVELRVEVE